MIKVWYRLTTIATSVLSLKYLSRIKIKIIAAPSPYREAIILTESIAEKPIFARSVAGSVNARALINNST